MELESFTTELPINYMEIEAGGNHQEIQHVEKLQKKILWELEDLEAQISNNHMIL